MGRVTEIRISGDNDAPIYPVRYEMHYLYCDECGSFELKTWVEPEDHEVLENRARQLGQLAGGIAAGVGIFTIFTFLDAIPIILIGAVVVIVLLIIRGRIKSRIKDRGVYCTRCNSRYEYGSPFFSSEANPKNYTEEDIPTPLYQNYQIIGSILGPVEEEK